MLSVLHHWTFFAQLPLAEAGQLLLIAAGAFAVITLIASVYRFHRIIQMDETEFATSETCNYFFHIQVARYLSKINRVSSGFGVFIIQFLSEKSDLRAAQEKMLALAESLIREESDKVCLFEEDCVAVIVDTEEESVPAVAERLTKDLKKALPGLPAVTAFRTGAARFPSHGTRAKDLVDAAAGAMKTAAFDEGPGYCLAPDPDPEESEESSSKKGSEEEEIVKNTAIDPETGILKPRVMGSAMRKYLAELRQKKNPATIFCIGINGMEDLTRLYGENTADDVIAGTSRKIQSLTRDSDLIGRYQRDSFIVLSPCSLAQGEKIAQRMRQAVQKETFICSKKQVKSSVSIGIAAFPDHGRLVRELFPKAVRALDVVREWNTSACLTYDPEQHDVRKKGGS